MAQTRLLCLAGVSGSGKDTAGTYLTDRHGFVRVALADAMKEVMIQLFDFTHEQMWGEGRSVPDPRLGRSPRELYQAFGQACVQIDPEVWIRPFRNRVGELVENGNRVVCTDLRTWAEFAALREMGGTTWLLERPGAGAPGKLALDRTETELTAAPRGTFDRVIPNDGSVRQLYERIDAAL